MAMLIFRIYKPILFWWNHNEESIWLKIFHILLDCASKKPNLNKTKTSRKFFTDNIMLTMYWYYLLCRILKMKAVFFVFIFLWNTSHSSNLQTALDASISAETKLLQINLARQSSHISRYFLSLREDIRHYK